MIKIRRGLDLPIVGKPEQVIYDGPEIRSVAVVGFDYIGMKPTMAVKEGDRVQLGQLLFSDKRNEGVAYTAPATGTVAAINRGERRVLQSVVIDVDSAAGEADAVKFNSWAEGELSGLERTEVVNNLVQSGLWAALRTRPYSKTPAIDSTPDSIFVTAIDTNPLAADPALIISENKNDFSNGLRVLTRLTEGAVHLCTAPGADIPTAEGVTSHEFAGPHPAGLVGTHIHFIAPVSAEKTVWHVGYQDVVAIGKLFASGYLSTDRIVALGGSAVDEPRLIRTRLGANLGALGTVAEGKRLLSGSVMSGRVATGPLAYLGRYHNQITILPEGDKRVFMRYMSPGPNYHSTLPIYLSSLSSSKTFEMDCNTNGSERAMVPIGNYEKVMPLDILPTQLLRTLIVGDTEMAQKLGCLELDEEDLALCTYVCIGKYEYGPILRDNLTRIEKEG